MFCVLAFGAVITCANDNTRSKSLELDVLSRYIGNWDVAFDSDDPFSTGTLTAQWVLGGAYLEQTGEFKARFVRSDVTIKTLTTYEVDTKQYKRWSFVSNGRALVSSGTWEPSTNTLTWVSEQFEPRLKRTILVKTIEEFRKDGIIEVCKVSTDSGREVGRSIQLRTPRK